MNILDISWEHWSIVLSDLRQKFLIVRTIREMLLSITQSVKVPYTRIIEHKHFEFGKQEKTVISREYSSEWSVGMEPYYPVNDEKNNALFEEYKKLAEKEENVIFGGRLGDYKYYDMDKVVAAALDRLEEFN